MTITVETGSGSNSAANSYASVATLQAYATARGFTLPGTDVACEILLIKAMDYIEALRDRFQGYKSRQSQPLQWPRAFVWVDGYPIATTDIPAQLVHAQCELAIIAYTTDLMPTISPTDVGPAKRKRVEGAVDVEYFEAPGKRTQPLFVRAEALINAICRPVASRLIRA